MKSAKYQLLLTIALMMTLMTALLLITFADEIHWAYDGDDGPAYWAELSPDYSLCADGSAQSPIDIRNASELDLVGIEFHYRETARDLEAINSIYNNSHTIQVNVASGSTIVYNGISYDLLQFHFHSPSEHTIDGVAAPMEIHFVHQDPNSGTLAVVGVMLTQGESRERGVCGGLRSHAGRRRRTGSHVNAARLGFALAGGAYLLHLSRLFNDATLQRNRALAAARFAGRTVG